MYKKFLWTFAVIIVCLSAYNTTTVGMISESDSLLPHHTNANEKHKFYQDWISDEPELFTRQWNCERGEKFYVPPKTYRGATIHGTIKGAYLGYTEDHMGRRVEHYAPDTYGSHTLTSETLPTWEYKCKNCSQNFGYHLSPWIKIVHVKKDRTTHIVYEASCGQPCAKPQLGPKTKTIWAMDNLMDTDKANDWGDLIKKLLVKARKLDIHIHGETSEEGKFAIKQHSQRESSPQLQFLEPKCCCVIL